MVQADRSGTDWEIVGAGRVSNAVEVIRAIMLEGAMVERHSVAFGGRTAQPKR